eukprot:2287980-Prymnesium_polylepis.1
MTRPSSRTSCRSWAGSTQPPSTSTGLRRWGVAGWKTNFAKMWGEVGDLLESQDSDARIQHGPTD